MLALIGLRFVVTKRLQKSDATDTLLGVVTIFLGALLATHDYIFTPKVAIPVHFMVACAILMVGSFQSAAAWPRRLHDVVAT